LRFDPATETFTEYKSLTYKTPNGTGTTYGAAGDREGNGWWAEMTLDIIGHADAKTGQASELKLPRVVMDKDLISDEQRAFYEKYASADFNQPVPWNEGPRRMGSDKNGDVLWVGNSWGGSLAKIDIHTMETSFVPLPGSGAMQPYHVAVDSGHNAWLNIWTSDVIMKFDPATNGVDDLRSAHARHRSPLHFPARARWQDGSDPALFAHQQGCGDDLPQRGRSASPQDAGRAIGRAARDRAIGLRCIPSPACGPQAGDGFFCAPRFNRVR